MTHDRLISELIRDWPFQVKCSNAASSSRRNFEGWIWIGIYKGKLDN